MPTHKTALQLEAARRRASR